MCSPLARVPYVVFFDLKPLNEDSNLQLCKFCMHAQKGAPKIHFRACKISIGSCPQAPHAQGLPRHLDTGFVNYATDPGAYYRTQVPLELLAGQHWYFAAKNQKKNKAKRKHAAVWCIQGE